MTLTTALALTHSWNENGKCLIDCQVGPCTTNLGYFGMGSRDPFTGFGCKEDN